MKKFLIISWFVIALPTFALTYHYNKDLFQPQKQNTIQKVEGIKQDIPEKLEPTVAPSNNQSLEDSTPQEKSQQVPIEKEISATSTVAPTSVPSPKNTIKPTPSPFNYASLEIASGENYQNYQIKLKADDTAFSVLVRAAKENDFQVGYQNYGNLGAFVSCIDKICNRNGYYWTLYYNDQYSLLGASSQLILDGDTITWQFEKK